MLRVIVLSILVVSVISGLFDPNTSFKLTIRDVEIIEEALRAKAGRRGMAIAQGATSERLREEMHEIQDVLGRIHEQKNFYAKFKDGKPYVSG